MAAATRKALLVNLAWTSALAIVLAVGYVGSYPLALRIIDQEDIAVYRPVQRLIDAGPLEGPMCRWAGIWKVDRNVIAASVRRKVHSGEIDLDYEGCGCSR